MRRSVEVNGWYRCTKVVEKTCFLVGDVDLVVSEVVNEPSLNYRKQLDRIDRMACSTLNSISDLHDTLADGFRERTLLLEARIRSDETSECVNR